MANNIQLQVTEPDVWSYGKGSILMWIGRWILVVIGSLLAYVVGPYLFSWWFHLRPSFEYGATTPQHWFGSSRWLAVASVVCLWNLYWRKIPVSHNIQKRATRLVIWVVSSILFAQCLFGLLFTLDTNMWVAVDTWPPDVSQRKLSLDTTYSIPIDVLLSAVRITAMSDEQTAHVHLKHDVSQGNSATEIPEISMEKWMVELVWLTFMLGLCLLFTFFSSKYIVISPPPFQTAARRNTVLLLFLTYYFSQVFGQNSTLGLMPVSIFNIVTSIPLLLAFSFFFTWLFKVIIYYREFY